jgi:predicted P-loop ATPase
MSKFITPDEILEKLIEEGTVDCYDEYEAKAGMMCCVEDQVECPFEAKVIGEKVTIIDLKSENELMAVCEKNGERFEVNIDSIKVLEPFPDGYEWLEAYQLFIEGGG